MRIDESRGDVLAGGVDDHGAGGRGELLPHAHDLTRLHQQVGVFQATLRTLRPHRGVAHQQHSRLCRRRCAAELHRRPDERQVDLRHLHRHRTTGGTFEGFGARAAIAGVGPVRERQPAEERRVTHRAGQQQRAFLPKRLAGERRFQTTGLGDDPHRRERHRATTGHFHRATDAIERPFETQRDVLERAGIVGGDRPCAARVHLRRSRDTVLPSLHPHVAHGRLFGEEIALANHEIGRLADGDRAVRFLDAKERGGHGRERRQRLVGREATCHGSAEIGKELRERGEAVGGDGERHAGGGQLRRVGGREVPVAEIGQRHVGGRFRARHVRRVGEVQRQHHRLRATLQHVEQPVFLTVAAKPRRELVVLRELVGAEVFLLAPGLEHDRLRSLHGFAEGRQRLTRFRRQQRAATGFVGPPRAAIPLGVHQRLLHERDGAHGGVGIHAAKGEGTLEAHRLREIGAQHAFAHTGVAEADHRGGAAEDALTRHGQCRPEAERAQRGATRGVVLEIGGRAEPRAHLRIPMRRSHVATLRRRVTAKVGGGIDEARIDREALEVPHAGASGRGHAGTNGGDEPVADDDRGVGQDLAGGGDDARAHQGVVARAVVAQAGHRLRARGLLGLERSGSKRRHAEEETKRSHRGLGIREGKFERSIGSMRRRRPRVEEQTSPIGNREGAGRESGGWRAPEAQVRQQGIRTFFETSDRRARCTGP